MNKIGYMLTYTLSVLAVILFSLLLIYRNSYTGISTDTEDGQNHVLINTLEMNLSDQWNNILSNISSNSRDSSLHQYVDSLKNPILVFRFKETNCHLCVNIELNRLRNWVKENNIECCLLTSYGSISRLKRILRMKDCSLNYQNISINGLNAWKSEEFENPYYFILHPDGLVSDFLYADKATPEITDLYLVKMKQIFHKIKEIK